VFGKRPRLQYAAPVYGSYYVAPAPVPVVSYYAAPVVTYAAPAAVVTYAPPAPVYTSYYAAPAPVVNYAPAPVAVTTTYTYAHRFPAQVRGAGRCVRTVGSWNPCIRVCSSVAHKSLKRQPKPFAGAQA